MLIEFRVENHRSLLTEQALSMKAGPLRDIEDERPRKVSGLREKVLPAVALYGANASGKSNILSAMAFMREAVLLSHSLWEPDSGIPRTPFAWGPKRAQSSLFEVSFLEKRIRYQYGFVANDEAIEEEWLFAWPQGRKQILFEREGSEFKFGENLRGPNETIRGVTRSNALFISVASQHRHEQLTSVYAWFRRISLVNIQGSRDVRGWLAHRPDFLRLFDSGTKQNAQRSLFPEFEREDDLGVRVRKLLEAADVGIVDVKVVREDDATERRPTRYPKIKFKHDAADDSSWLDLSEESQGTQTLFNMALPVFRALDIGGLLVIDELEASLHPLLGQAIVRLFNSPETNSRNAQLVFTTHDTNLLGTTTGPPLLRRDQIWFTEKDKKGESVVYPLTRYKPRGVENLERGYLQGRYGAIPFLGNISAVGALRDGET